MFSVLETLAQISIDGSSVQLLHAVPGQDVQ